MKQHNTTRHLLGGIFILGLCLAANPLVAAEPAMPAMPNVVFILADDLGWADTTLYGHTKFYRTPNLDRLAKRGMTFNRAYSASPLCSPTRASILTGLNPARIGITSPVCHETDERLEATPGKARQSGSKSTNCTSATRLKLDYVTIAESLKAAGYATGHFGKWHLGPEPFSPLQQGFDVDVPHYAGPGPAGSYVAPWKFKDFDADPGEPHQHLEDRMAKEAVAFIEKHKDAPFFLNYWMFSVHAPFNAKKALIENYRARVNPADPQRSPTYAAMVESMDDAVGTLMNTLDRLNLSDKTIIVFFSDNGGNMYDEVDGTTPTSNAPLRGGKATVYEGGVRVPCVVCWPGTVATGARSDTVIQSVDFYPTLLEMLSLKPAEGQRFDGASIVPALKGQPLTRDAIFTYFPHDPHVPDWLPPSVSVLRGDWKLIRIFYGGENGAHRHLLFNLKDDSGEKNNVAAQKPELVRELDTLIANFLADTKAVVPVQNPAFNPADYHPELEGITDRKRSKPAKSKATVDPLQGWKVRGCEAVVTNGIVRISKFTEASFLGFSAAWHSGPSSVKLRMKAAAGTSHLDWLPAGPQDKAQSVPFTLTGGDWEEITIAIPATGPLGVVRLYLPQQEQPIELDWIKIVSSETGKSTKTRF